MNDGCLLSRETLDELIGLLNNYSRASTLEINDEEGERGDETVNDDEDYDE